MKQVILKEKQIKTEDGKLLGTSRVVIDEKSLQEAFKKHGDPKTRSAKKSKLKAFGYSDDDIVKIEREELI